jgi:DNA-binding transcriptional MerR regulator
MARRYLRIAEVVSVCSVSREFILSLEREQLISAVMRKREKVYPLDQVDRIRVAQVLIREMGVNLEGVDVALHMREQLIPMRRMIAALLGCN